MVSSEGNRWGGGGGRGGVPYWNWSTPSVTVPPWKGQWSVYWAPTICCRCTCRYWPSAGSILPHLGWFMWGGGPIPISQMRKQGLNNGSKCAQGCHVAGNCQTPTQLCQTPRGLCCQVLPVYPCPLPLLPGFILRICLSRDKQLHTKFKGVAEQSNPPCPPTHTEK